MEHSKRPSNPVVSIIVPVLNEEESVDLFVQTVRRELEKAVLDFEILFINDGSFDKTLDRLIGLIEQDRRIRVINFSRNFGKEVALTAGIDHAAGDVLIPMDVDLQDPPDLIPVFLEKWREGYDVVYGVRSSRRHDNVVKRTTAALFYSIFNSLSHLHVPENAGDFRLIDRRVAETIRQMPERNRFMKGLFAWVGYNSVGIPYERPKRAAGNTKWSNWRLWNFALDGLISFSTLPLRVWTYIGGGVALFSFTYGSFIIVRTLILGVDIPGYASLLTVILFLGGLQMLSIGVLGEYLGRLFIEVKARPLYVVESIYPPHASPQVAVNDQD
jgi:glycosyltransferase involved in cell wall biosynthesis